MIVSEWNLLRAGDTVMVHEPPYPPGVPVQVVVSRMIPHGEGVNEVAVQLADGGLLWPVLTAVHRAQPAGDPSCWRCRATSTGLAGAGWKTQ